VVLSQPGQTVRETLSQKTQHKKWAGGVTEDKDPEFKPQYHKKKEEEEEEGGGGGGGGERGRGEEEKSLSTNIGSSVPGSQ
jgi:hypothetical protein